LIARSDPPLSLARLRAHGQLLEIRALDLQFSADEVATLFNEKMGLTSLPAKLDGLERFYMAGQWVQMGGGITGVVQSARNTVRQIRRDLGRPFVSGA
jgi:hypothetical protein